MRRNIYCSIDRYLITCRPILGLCKCLMLIIIATTSIVTEDEWGDSECLMYKACQLAITDEGLFKDTGIDEQVDNERQSEND